MYIVDLGQHLIGFYITFIAYVLFSLFNYILVCSFLRRFCMVFIRFLCGVYCCYMILMMLIRFCLVLYDFERGFFMWFWMWAFIWPRMSHLHDYKCRVCGRDSECAASFFECSRFLDTMIFQNFLCTSDFFEGPAFLRAHEFPGVVGTPEISECLVFSG